MKKNILITIFLFSTLFSFSQTPDARTVLNKMFEACRNTTRFSSFLLQEERFGIKIRKSKQEIKVSTKPTLRALVSIVESEGFGESGTEICYPSKYNSNNACFMTFMAKTAKGKVHNIYDNVLCEKDKQHHPFPHIGFQYLMEVINFNIKQDSVKFFRALSIKEQPTFYELTIDDNQYNENVLYKVKGVGDGDFVTIAKTKGISQLKVYELNKEKKLDYCTPLKPGELLKIPSSYSRKTILYVNKINYLPLTQIIYDNNPTIPYEKYVFEGFNANPKFSDSVFNCD